MTARHRTAGLQRGQQPVLGLTTAVLCAWMPAGLVAQATTPHAEPHNNSVSRGATHAPKPELPPLVAWHFVKTGNAAFVALREQAERLARHGIKTSPRSTSEHGPTAHGNHAASGDSSGHGHDTTGAKQGAAHGTTQSHEKPHVQTKGHAPTNVHTDGDAGHHATKPAPTTDHGTRHDAESGHSAQMGHATVDHDQTSHDKQELPQRPAGAGKYVCAVITCADMPFSVADLCGLERKDVLVFRMPGLRANAETVAMLERVIRAERLSLVLVLGHTACDALRARKVAKHDVLDRRVAALKQRAKRASRGLLEMAVLQQREQIVAGSDLVQRLLRRDQLRVLPGIIDGRNGGITWKNRRAAAMPLSPVK